MSVLLGAAPPATEVVSVLAYNVLFQGSDHQRSVALIQKSDPDIVCLREVTPAFVGTFRRALGRTYPHQRFRPKQGTWGLGIVSKYRLSGFRRFPAKPHRLPAGQAVVHLPRGPLTVVCVHLMPPVAKRRASDGVLASMEKNAELRRRQGRYLARRFRRHRGPILIAGDFNEGASGAALDTLRRSGFENACQGDGAHCGATWPVDTFFWPAAFDIDHILGRGVVFSGAQVLKGGGSDHFAIYARFQVRRRPESGRRSRSRGAGPR